MLNNDPSPPRANPRNTPQKLLSNTAVRWPDKTCVAGAKKACNDSNVCAKDLCSSSTGMCVHSFEIMDGMSCGLNQCCVSGVCKVSKFGTCMPF